MFSPVLVHEFLSCSPERLPNKTALICEEERWTYRALDQASDRAAGLFRSLGLKRGGRVAIFLDNCVETVISLYGTLKAGGVFVVIDGSTKAKKLGTVLADAGPSVLVTRTEKAAVVTAALRSREHGCASVWAGEPADIPRDVQAARGHLEDLRAAPGERCSVPGKDARGGRLHRPGPGSGHVYFRLHGRPKGVMVSHLNMVSAAHSIRYLENRGRHDHRRPAAVLRLRPVPGADGLPVRRHRHP